MNNTKTQNIVTMPEPLSSELSVPLSAKLEALRDLIRSMESVLVAYSGGVDSALVMAVAHAELGDKALACIGVSPSYPAREMRDAVKLAEALGIPFRLVDTEEYLDENYASNPTNRCYFCKSELHNRLKEVLTDEANHAFVGGVVLDGTNASDLGDDRPGIDAARERGVRSPLVELGITKDEIRQLAHHLGLPVWAKPAMACLSSRVPHGTAITPELLRQIEAAEDVLVDLGFEQFRVRHHGSNKESGIGDLARIEIPPDSFPLALEHHTHITEAVKAAGYRFVTLDLGGFRSGSLNSRSLNLQPSTNGQ